jgi:hypothetical protein
MTEATSRQYTDWPCTSLSRFVPKSRVHIKRAATTTFTCNVSFQFKQCRATVTVAVAVAIGSVIL